MKRIITGVLLAVLAGGPSVSWAGTTREAPAAVDQSPTRRPAAPAPVAGRTADQANYAAREAATPELGKFEGGSVGIYIGGGALTVVLIVVLLLVLL